MKKEEIINAIKKENITLFSANDLYLKFFKDTTNEMTFFKHISRLKQENIITRVSKGIYSLNEPTIFGPICPSDKDIINEFIKNKSGIVVGYDLFNKTGVSTQVSTNTEVYSKNIKENEKNFFHIHVKRADLEYTKEICDAIEVLEILENYLDIYDLNESVFVEITKDYSKKYNEEVIDLLIRNIGYKKRTIAFLKEILDFYNVNNNLSKYLSALSKYKIPNYKEIYEFTQ